MLMGDMEGDDSLSSFGFLSGRERKLLLGALRSFKADTETLSSFKQIREMVPIRKWLDTPYYCGPDCARLYDFWKDVLADVFDTFPSKYNEVILTGGIGIGKCVVGDTRILTGKGYLPISSFDNNRKTGFSPLTVRVDAKVYSSHFYKEYDCDTIKIENNYVRIEGTPEHRVLALTDKGVDWKRLDEIKETDYLAFSKSKRILFNKITPKPSILSHISERDWGYLIGLYFGDGSLTNNGSGNPARWSYSGQLETVTRVEKITGNIGWKKNHRSRNNWTIHLNNVEAARELYELGLNGNAYTKKIPDWVFSSNEDFLIGYISGYIDADGTVRDIDTTSMSQSLIYGFRDILNLFGIYPRITPKKVTWKNQVRQGYRLRVAGTYLKNLIVYPYSVKLRGIISYIQGLELQCKSRNLKLKFPLCSQYEKEILQIMKSRKKWSRSHYGDVLDSFKRGVRLHYISDYSLTKGLSYFKDWGIDIEPLKMNKDFSEYYLIPVGKGNISNSHADVVYDVSVPKTHRFYANGLINHNSTVALYGMMRHLYEISCFTNIPALMGLMSYTQLVFIYFSLTKMQAELTGFGQLRTLLDTVPYFRKEFPRDAKINSLLYFPPNILMNCGSDISHSIGMTTVGTILDEANFHQETQASLAKGDYKKVSNLYESNLNRAVSRMVSNGKNYSLSWLVSSASSDTSFTEQRIAKAMEEPTIKVVEGRLWEVKGRHKYSMETFYVFKGNEAVEPFVVEQSSDLGPVFVYDTEIDSQIDYNKSPREILSKVPMRYQKLFLEVPRDLHARFKGDLLKALQDLGGISTSPQGKLFTSISAYRSALFPEYKHPFSREYLVIATGDNIKIQDFLWPDFEFKHPNRPRFIHVDQSTTSDCTGISSVFLDSITEVEGIRKPVIGIDFMLQIKPPQAPRKISIGKVRDFIFYMRDMLNLPIGCASYDWAGGDESLQVLEEGNIRCKRRSVEKDEPYLALCNLYFESRIKTYDYKPYRDELFALNHLRLQHKVDHPSRGCFTGDMKIKLGNGTVISFKELYDSGINTFEVEAYDISHNQIRKVPAKNCRITKYVKDLMQITLSNKEVIKCTIDHPFLLNNGTYLEAQQLTLGQSLMGDRPLYVKSMKYISENSPIPVYDITVPSYENFALSSGVFVHNSKDVADSLCGAVANLLDEPLMNLDSKQASDHVYFDLGGVSNLETDKSDDRAMRDFLLDDYR